MNRPRLGFCHAVRPEGEDCFALSTHAPVSGLCVTDGCGGIGGRRYAACGGHTGAYLASRLAAQAFESFSEEVRRCPRWPEEGVALRRKLEKRLDAAFRAFAASHGMLQTGRVVGSLQRVLPTTLCCALTQPGSDGLELCFLWSGDSRGYVLDAGGLHQCTHDHLRGDPDAYESLYLDAPLSRCLSADRETRLSLRILRLTRPGMVLLATDGVYGALPTPMEMEFTLLHALAQSENWEIFSQRLQDAFGKRAQDDATLVLQSWGVDSFAILRALAQNRRDELEAAYLLPLRQQPNDRGTAEALWRRYRQTYDWTGGERA